jgi:predicted dehydrogenase
MSNKHLLILGAGSVGKRHIQNLSQLGCCVSVMDPNTARLELKYLEIEPIHTFQSMNEIEQYWQEFDGVLVCSPPKFHLDQSVTAAKFGLSILSEKPLTRNLKEAINLLKVLESTPNVQFLLGYTYRWWRPLKLFRDKLSNKQIGKPLHARFIMSAHLADWHPWEAYQDFFMSSKELGGGALLDESHFVDLMLWFFGMPESVTAQIDKLSDLDIETDDNVDIIVKYKDGLRVSIHLDLFGRPHEKYISVTGEGSSLQWSFNPNVIKYSNKMEQNWEQSEFDLERNDMFIEVVKEFLEMLDGKKDINCTLNEGVQVMKILEACRLSSREHRTVNLKEI